MALNAFQHQQLAQQRKESHRDNAARVMSLYVEYETTGDGRYMPKQPVLFSVPFLEQPSQTHGFVLDREPQKEIYDLPTVTSGVRRWERNQRGYYIGAYLYFNICCDFLDTYEPLSAKIPPASPIILHHFVFNGLAYKVMSKEINDAAASDDRLVPLTPPAS